MKSLAVPWMCSQKPLSARCGRQRVPNVGVCSILLGLEGDCLVCAWSLAAASDAGLDPANFLQSWASKDVVCLPKVEEWMGSQAKVAMIKKGLAIWAP